MSRSVLVPIDGSNFAEHALPFGLSIARRTHATLHLVVVHVPPDVLSPAYPLATSAELRHADQVRDGTAYLEALVERLAPAEIPLRPAALGGHVAQSLARYVEAEDIGVVAMTTHGRGGVQRAWLGSTTDGMIRHCRAPLLLVRPSEATREIGPGSDRTFRRVLVALDGDDNAETALRDVVQLGVADEASFVLAHVLPPAAGVAWSRVPSPEEGSGPADRTAREAPWRAYLARIAARELDGRDVECHVVTDFNAAPAILALAEATGADLLVLGTHGRIGLPRMILGSVADKVIRGTRRAVLVHRGSGRMVRMLGIRTGGASAGTGE